MATFHRENVLSDALATPALRSCSVTSRRTSSASFRLSRRWRRVTRRKAQTSVFLERSVRDGTGFHASQEIARRIQADLGPRWPRNRTLPDAVVASLCEALWDEGVSPTRRIVQRCLPGWNEHAMGPGVVAWRIKKGLPQQGVRGPRAVPTNAVELAKIVSPAIRSEETLEDGTIVQHERE